MHGIKRKYISWVQVNDPEVNEKITRQSWDVIPMPDTVIDQVNILGQYQHEQLVFTDYKGPLIGNGDVDITGVGGGGGEMRPH